jgi:hypothetical protein
VLIDDDTLDVADHAVPDTAFNVTAYDVPADKSAMVMGLDNPTASMNAPLFREY